MFRRPLLLSPPDWLRTLWIGDWPILMLLAEQGYVGYIDEVMAEYRIHPGGVWSGSSHREASRGLAAGVPLRAPALGPSLLRADRLAGGILGVPPEPRTGTCRKTR